MTASLLDQLAAVGRARANGIETEPLASTPEEISRALHDEDWSVLEAGSVALIEAFDDGDDNRIAECLQSTFAARDRVEWILLGAETLGAVLGVEVESYLVEFEELLRPELPRMTALNDSRGSRAAAITPSYRARFWWWTEGAGIAPDAHSSLTEVAELVARFPALEAKLNDAIQAARDLQRPVRPVTSIAEWLAKKRGPDAALALAAASQIERIPLVQTPQYAIEWRLPDVLVLDCFAELSAPPTVAKRRMEPVPDTLDRYRIKLDSATLLSASLTIVIPFVTGKVKVVLPP